MNPKHFIPGLGNSGTAKRFRELEKRAGTLPVLFALFASEAIKITTLAFPSYTRDVYIDIATMIILSIVTGALYVYEIDLDDIV